MKLNRQNTSIKKLFESQSTHFLLIDIFKGKDYNAITHKIQAYRKLTLDLQMPNLANANYYNQLRINIQAIDHNLNDILLNCDQIVQDVMTMGFKCYSDLFDRLLQIVKIQHEFMLKKAKTNLSLMKSDEFSNQKIFSKYCQGCNLHKQASHIKKLKRQMGMEYPNNDQRGSQKIQRQKQDILVKQKEQFIDQLNSLLSKKQQYLKIDPFRYQELVNSLHKLCQIHHKRTKKQTNKQSDIQKIITLQKELEDTNKLEDNYDKIIDEVKQILNAKLKQGYSGKIRSMLDQFQIVLKTDKNKNVKQHIFINTHDIHTQTSSTLQSTEIKLLQAQLDSKETQLSGVKQIKQQMADYYHKVLDNQRKISREASHQIATAKKNEQLRQQIQDKIKQNSNLKDLIKELYASLDNKEDNTKTKRIGNFRINQKNNSDSSKYKNNTLNTSKIVKIDRDVTKKIQNILTDHQTQTDSFNIKELSELCSEQAQRQRLGKKRLHHRASRINYNDVLQSNILLKQIKDDSQIVANKNNIHSKVYQLILNPQNDKNIAINILTKETDQFSRQKGQKKNKKKHVRNTNKSFNRIQANIRRTQNIKISSKKMKQSKKIQGRQNVKQQLPKPTRKMVRKESIVNILSSQNIQYKYVQTSHNGYEGGAQENRKKSRFAEDSQNSIDNQTNKISYRNINSIRFIQVPLHKFRINSPKIDHSVTQGQNTHYTTIINKEKIVKINKYQNKRNSYSNDKQKLRQIVSLLKQKQHLHTQSSSKIRHSKIFDKSIAVTEHNQKPYSSDHNNESVNDEAKKDFEAEQEIQESTQTITQNILNAKIIIQSQYTYLKAAGFIDYLESIRKKLTAIDRNIIKTKFQFTHLDQSNLQIFGGSENVVKYYTNTGIWKCVKDDENELKINLRHRNFAHKIVKYFYLLKKMNRQFFQQYTSFIFNPYQFSYKNFKSDVNNSVNKCLENNQGHDLIYDKNVSTEQNLIQIMMKIITFHQVSHGDCQHIPEFLNKVGYYRYSY